MELKKVIILEYYAGTEQEIVITRDARNQQEKPVCYDSLQKVVDDLRAAK